MYSYNYQYEDYVKFFNLLKMIDKQTKSDTISILISGIDQLDTFKLYLLNLIQSQFVLNSFDLHYLRNKLDIIHKKQHAFVSKVNNLMRR